MTEKNNHDFSCVLENEISCVLKAFWNKLHWPNSIALFINISCHKKTIIKITCSYEFIKQNIVLRAWHFGELVSNAILSLKTSSSFHQRN